MKRLFLLRHAKSAWDEPDLSDFERTLNDRGTKAAASMGKLVVRREYKIDAIVSSPARRAAETARLFSEAANIGTAIEFVDRIYEASPQTLCGIASAFSDDLRSPLIVGHNPGMEGFIRLLTARSETMPTAALAVIDLGVRKWNEIVPGCATLVEVIRPREQEFS
ncbi:MAG: SixA phosphatase family protein [Pyrinomonadaceae bacterium]